MSYVGMRDEDDVGKTVEMRTATDRISALIRLGFLALCIACGGLQATHAQTDQKAFRVSIAGFPVGTASYSSAINGKRYEVQGFMGSTGFFGAFLASRYSGAVIGRISGERLTPQIFRGRFEQGRRFAEVDVKYSKGRPSRIIRRPERPAQPHDIDPTKVRGALDPISAMFFMLKDRTVDKVCTQRFQVFEGSRTSRITMQRAQGDNGTVICNGVYTRLGGFTPEQMAERQNFPFQMVFHPTESGLFEVREFRATTFWGVARATLRQR